MGVATGYGFKEILDFLILLIPTPLVSVLFYSSISTFCSFLKIFFVLGYYTPTHVLYRAVCVFISLG